MNKRIFILFGTTLFFLTSMSIQAALFDSHYKKFSNSTLTGIKTVAINIDRPTNYDYDELARYGVTKEGLQELMTQRLRDAGFDVISLEQALENPEASLIDLRIRLITPRYHYFAYYLDLSVIRKVPLPQGNNSFYSVTTWSDGQNGALQQTGFHYINDYTINLVDNFIQAHQSQN